MSTHSPSRPGPIGRQWLERRQASVPRAISMATPAFVQHAHNATVQDVDGLSYIDFAGGIGALNTGHTHPMVVEAIIEQATRYLHTSVNVAPSPLYITLAERLNALMPGPGPYKTLLANSGAEAVENAVKIARYATGRSAVVVFTHAFHGRTQLAMTLTSKAKPYKDGFGPFAPEVYRAPYPYCLRCPTGQRTPCCQLGLSGLRELFAAGVAPERVACVVIEPIAGEGGFIVPPAGFLPALAELCRQHGILLVADEIQTGFGRTGDLFAIQHEGVVPDLLVLSKSLGGGLVLSAVTGRADVMDAPPPGGLGGTFGGNPLSVAAALAALDVLEQEGLVARALHLGTVLGPRFRSWQQRLPGIGDVRGRGAMWALELVRADGSPDKERADKVVQLAFQRGLLLLTAGTWGNVLRTLMPLTIEEQILEDGLKILADALEEVTISNV